MEKKLFMIRSNINNKTKLYISISLHPGNKGAKFFNYLFQIKKKNAVYLPLKLKNIKNIKNIINELNIAGCSVSMPFKKKILKYVDKKDKIVKVTNCANTILKKNKQLIAFNFDYMGIKKVLDGLKILNKDKILILGNGAMAMNTIYYLQSKKFENIYVCSRKNIKIKGVKLFGWRYRNKVNSDVIINCTPIGMPHINKLPINIKKLVNLKYIIDYTINNSSNLKKTCEKYKLKYIGGDLINFYQACFQASVYLGKNLTINQIKKLKKKFRIF